MRAVLPAVSALLFLGLCWVSLAMGEPFPEIPPGGAIPKTETIKASGVRPHNYPYYATAERRAVILDKASRVNEGQLAAEVEKILGRPDEINGTFGQVKGKEKTGYSYVYLVQRLRERGSELEKDEKLIRIHFGLDDRVRRIDRKL